jgi:large subunit ribosomal protein L10
MGLNRQEKAAVVEEVGALVAKSQSIVVAEYRGLDVDAITRLRKQARRPGCAAACAEEHVGSVARSVAHRSQDCPTS